MFNYNIFDNCNSQVSKHDKKTNKQILSEKPWIDEECRLEKKRIELLLLDCQMDSFCEESTRIYKRNKNLYGKLLKFKKKAYYDLKLEKLSSARDPETFWKLLKQFRGKSRARDPISLNTWVEFYRKTFRSRSEVIIEVKNRVVPDLDSDFKLAELEESLKNVKKTKPLE